MRFARDLLQQAVDTVAPPEPPPAAPPAMMANILAPPPPPPPSPGGRLLLAWIAIVVGAAALSALLWWLSALVFQGHAPGFLADTVIAAAVIGFLFLFLCSAKFITAIFGVLAGTSAQTALTGDGVLSASNAIVTKLIAGFTVVFPAAAAELGGDTLHTGGYVFYVLVVLIAIPAFVTE